jgi:hypothetical protein
VQKTLGYHLVQLQKGKGHVTESTRNNTLQMLHHHRTYKAISRVEMLPVVERYSTSIPNLTTWHVLVTSADCSSCGLKRSSLHKTSPLTMANNETLTAEHIRIAHIGNSIQYYNDCPRLLESIFKDHYGSDKVTQDSCLRGGASLVSIWTKGNGMATKFGTPNAIRPDGTYDIGRSSVQELLKSEKWDFVIMNDHTQSPARNETKENTMNILAKEYLPLLSKSNKTSVVVFLMTAAYRRPVNGSDDLGSFEDFTMQLHRGYAAYKDLIPNSKVAPVGLAFQHIKDHYSQNKDCANFSWEMLYASDYFHPSPHGTLLQAFVLFITLTGQVPPVYSASWWGTARYMQPPEEDPLPLPSLEEGALLRSVACTVCNLSVDGRHPKSAAS